MSKQTKELVRRFYEAYSTGNVQDLDAIVTPDFVSYQNSNPEPQALGVDALRRHIASGRSSMNPTFTIEELIAEGDRVVARYVMQGIVGQPLLNNPSTVGKPFKVRGCAIFRVANGRLAERWVNVDQLGWLQQAGAMPGS